MKRNSNALNLFILFMCIISMIALPGCSMTSATKIQYDSGSPPEKNCTLNIAGPLAAKKFDGQDVNWRNSIPHNWAQVQIPEGKHTFVFDYEYPTTQGGTFSSYQAKDISVTYDRFAAGHTYVLVAQMTINMSIKIGVKDVTDDPDWFGSLRKGGIEWLPIRTDR